MAVETVMPYCKKDRMKITVLRNQIMGENVDFII